jgi:UDP-2,3-diacylglucosamine pyrophosphatase LpxH
MTLATTAHRYHFRTLFLSDIHLGSRNCKAKMLRELLNHVDADTIYLVGDIIDGERLKHRDYWPLEHEEVLQLLAQKAQSGTKVIYIAGNHDEGLRDWMHGKGIARNNFTDSLCYRNFMFKQAAIHEDATGTRHLIIHGDQFDGLLQRGHALDWMLPVGDALYDALAFANRHLNQWGEKLGLPYWSLSGAVKGMFKQTAAALNHAEDKMIALMREQGVTQSLFGHTHMPQVVQREGYVIRNDGDMVDSITAFVEDARGEMKLLDWAPIYNEWKQACTRKSAQPQAVFAPLATHYGGIPTDKGPMADFSAIARQSGRVKSQYQELIDLATHGAIGPQKWQFPTAKQRSQQP